MSWKGPTRIRVQLLALHRHPRNLTLCLRALSKHSLNSVRLGAVTTLLEACSVLNHPLGEKPFCNIQPKPPLTQLHAIYSSPVTGHQREEIGTCPSTSPREEGADLNEV